MKSVPERPDVRRAEEFLNLVKSWLEDEDIPAVVVVHCVSGVSRSPVPAKRTLFQTDVGHSGPAVSSKTSHEVFPPKTVVQTYLVRKRFVADPCRRWHPRLVPCPLRSGASSRSNPLATLSGSRPAGSCTKESPN